MINGMLVYHLAVSAFLLIVTLTIAGNWFVFVAPRRRRFEPGGTTPLVSVMVPARNEALRISPCLRSLCAQDYPNYELLVLDDHSQDDTARVILDHGFSWEKHSRRRLLDGQPLPEGWTGKSWACHQLASAAKGEYLVFTDADTVHDPAALGAFVGHAIDTGAGLLSAWPRQVTGTWSERAVIPLVYVLLLGALPHYVLWRLQRRPDYARWTSRGVLGALGAANGQYMLFRRDVYEQIGGHAAVRDHLVEDVALGRQVAQRTAEGLRLIHCAGSRLYVHLIRAGVGRVHEEPAGRILGIRGGVLDFRAYPGGGAAVPFCFRAGTVLGRPLVVDTRRAGGLDLPVASRADGAVPHVVGWCFDAPARAWIVAAHRTEQLALERAEGRDLEGTRLPDGRRQTRGSTSGEPRRRLDLQGRALHAGASNFCLPDRT